MKPSKSLYATLQVATFRLVLSSTQHLSVNSSEETRRQLDELCDPTESESPPSCPVARCAKPPDGCEYIFDHYVVNGVGNCCASLCYAVNATGSECAHDRPTDTAQEKQLGEQCDPAECESKPICAVADCAEPPAGCKYVFDHFVVDRAGNCCAKPCYAVDPAGNECAHESIPTAANVPGSVGEQCDPGAFENYGPCAVAGCANPPTGCEYVVDRFVVNGEGNCCARLCFAVDSNGNECVDMSGTNTSIDWLTPSLLFLAVLAVLNYI